MRRAQPNGNCLASVETAKINNHVSDNLTAVDNKNYNKVSDNHNYLTVDNYYSSNLTCNSNYRAVKRCSSACDYVEEVPTEVAEREERGRAAKCSSPTLQRGLACSLGRNLQLECGWGEPEPHRKSLDIVIPVRTSKTEDCHSFIGQSYEATTLTASFADRMMPYWDGPQASPDVDELLNSECCWAEDTALFPAPSPADRSPVSNPEVEPHMTRSTTASEIGLEVSESYSPDEYCDGGDFTKNGLVTPDSEQRTGPLYVLQNNVEEVSIGSRAKKLAELRVKGTVGKDKKTGIT